MAYNRDKTSRHKIVRMGYAGGMESEITNRGKAIRDAGVRPE